VLPGLEELLDERVGGDVADDHHLLLLRVYVRLVHAWIRIRGAGASVQQQYIYTKEKDQTTQGEKSAGHRRHWQRLVQTFAKSLGTNNLI
jgi:hypothetical protein